MTDLAGLLELVETRTLKKLHRRTVGDWTRAACKRATENKGTLSTMMGMVAPWLVNRTASRDAIVLTMDQLDMLSRLTGHPVSREVRAARAALDSLSAAGRTKRIKQRGVIVLRAGTAEREMIALMELSQRLRMSAHEMRNVGLLKMRFGAGTGIPMTLQQVGDALGLSGERVRKLEAAALQTLEENTSHIRTPALDAVLEMTKQMPTARKHATGARLKRLLGSVPLPQAIRFHQAIRPAPTCREISEPDPEVAPPQTEALIDQRRFDLSKCH